VLETLGRASLPVFCAHVLIVLLVLAMIGDRIGRTPLWAETLLLISTLIGLYAVALLSNRLDREQRAERDRQPVSARTGG
jgi:peptidoglycan/LPS O-acetylase OafA/YrhL